MNRKFNVYIQRLTNVLRFKRFFKFLTSQFYAQKTSFPQFTADEQCVQVRKRLA